MPQCTAPTKFCLALLGCLLSWHVTAQDGPRFEVGGYLKNLQTAFVPSPDTLPWFSDNTLENRLRLKYYPTQWLTVDVQSRSRFMYGDFVKLVPGYRESVEAHMGYADLSWVWGSGSSYILHTELDRLNVKINLGQWQVTAGRQRVNWGQNLVWNPNDLVNTYNYFNFEYEERPGVDALNVRFHPTFASVAEAVYVYHPHSDSMSIGGLYRFNRWGFDIQALGGAFGPDWAVGTGWSGHIGPASFRGEATYLWPRVANGQSNALIAAISADYTFGNNNYIHVGALFNSSGQTHNAGGIALFDGQALSPRSLSRGRYNLFAQVSGQPTPLITLGVGAIANPTDGSMFVSPTASFSVSDEFDFGAVLILFTGRRGEEFGGIGQLGYLRFRYSF